MEPAVPPFAWDGGARVFASPEALMAFAAAYASSLEPGTVLALCGGLGAGKTHFTKGLVLGLGCAEPVSSPTFSLVQEYLGGRLPVFHFDLYRTSSPAEVLALGWDDYLDQPGICVAEWADLFPMLFPENTHWLWLEVTGPEERVLMRRTTNPG